MAKRKQSDIEKDQARSQVSDWESQNGSLDDNQRATLQRMIELNSNTAEQDIRRSDYYNGGSYKYDKGTQDVKVRNDNSGRLVTKKKETFSLKDGSSEPSLYDIYHNNEFSKNNTDTGTDTEKRKSFGIQRVTDMLAQDNKEALSPFNQKNSPAFTTDNTSSDKSRKGFLGFLDRTLGRFSKAATDVFFPGVVDQQYEQLQKEGKDNPIWRESTSAPDNGFEKAADIAGTIFGYTAPTGAAYKAVSKPIQLLTKGKELTGAAKLGVEALRGTAAGTALGIGEAARDEAFVPDEKDLSDHLKRIGLNAAGGAILDPVAAGLGGVIQKMKANKVLDEIEKANVIRPKDAPLDPKVDFTPTSAKNQVNADDVYNTVMKRPNSNSMFDNLIEQAKREQDIKPNSLSEAISPLKSQQGNIDEAVQSVAKQKVPKEQGYLNIDHGPTDEPGLIRVNNVDNIQTFKNNNDGVIPDTSGHIVSKTEKEKLPLSYLKSEAYIKMIDDMHALNKFDKAVEKVTGKPLNPSEQTYKLALNSRGSDMVTNQMLMKNMLNSQGEVTGQSLRDIVSQVPKGKMKEFEDYLVNKHAITRMERGENVFPDDMKMSPEKSTEIAKRYEEQYPEFKNVADQYYEYNNQAVKGWLGDFFDSPESMQKMFDANPNYVSNQRKFSKLEMPLFSKAKGAFSSQSNPIKAADKNGSQRQIISPVESTIEQMDKYVKTAKRNEVMKALINNLQKDPEAFKDIARIVPTKEGNQALHSADDLENVLESFNSGFDKKQRLDGGNAVFGMINGKKVHVEVQDPQLLDAISNLQPQAQGFILNAVGQVTRMMKTLTTGINPVFSVARNVWRDIPTAYGFSKTTNNPITFGKDLVGAMINIAKNDGVYNAYKNMGGGHSSSVSSDIKLLSQAKNKLLNKKGIGPTIERVIGGVENFNNVIETAPRLAEYKRVAKGGTYDDKVKGLFEANDITTNFQKRGPVGKEADKFIPYLNAALQGLDKYGRTALNFKSNPKLAAVTTAKSVVGITIPTLALYYFNHNDPNYQQMSQRTKDTYFLIPNGDETFTKIPKPRELGVWFGSGVERTLEAMRTQDPKAFEGFMETIRDNFMPPTRHVFAPFDDLRANKDFADRPIVPGDLQEQSPENQYDAKTSEISKGISAGLNYEPIKKVLDSISPQNVNLHPSPKQLDYLAKSYTGILGQLGIPAATKDASVLDTLKQQVTADPAYSNDAVGKFYDTKQKLTTASKDVAAGHESDNLDADMKKYFDKQSKEISKVRKEQKDILNNSSLSREERQDQARRLQKVINDLANMANQQYGK